MATLARATASYAEVKRARRLLRGLAMAYETNGQSVAIIASHMATISDAQLEFGNLAHDVRTSPAGSWHVLSVERGRSLRTAFYFRSWRSTACRNSSARTSGVMSP
jgi:hypothetical protein